MGTVAMFQRTLRELTPADVRVLEPDLLGAIAVVLYGRDPRPAPAASGDSQRSARRPPRERAS
jgi:hypothetical protein